MHNHGLSAGHEHHGHHRPKDASSERALTWALALNATFLVIEAAVGWWANSLALLSDAAHMLSDVTALAIALIATRLAGHAATAARTFGLRRAEPVGAFVNALGLVVACIFIFAEAAERLTSQAPDVPGMPVFVIGAVGLTINLGSAWALARGNRDNLNIRGALLHMMADALGSLGAMIAAVAIMGGIAWADSAVSVFIGALVLVSAIGLVKDAGRVLLEMTPPGVDLDEMTRQMVELPGVRDVHDLHVWSLDGQYTLLTAHIVVGDAVPTEPVRLAAEQLLKAHFGIEHHTLQLERDATCESSVCAACGGPSSSSDERRA
ncbi:MAG: cation transporter [Myxococcales bacterium]|nr:cation transporter [Myxococcales bacterium]